MESNISDVSAQNQNRQQMQESKLMNLINNFPISSSNVQPECLSIKEENSMLVNDGQSRTSSTSSAGTYHSATMANEHQSPTSFSTGLMNNPLSPTMMNNPLPVGNQTNQMNLCKYGDISAERWFGQNQQFISSFPRTESFDHFNPFDHSNPIGKFSSI